MPEWDHVVEIKFKKLRGGSGPPMEDMLQAAAYASLYGKPRAALLYVYDNDVRGGSSCLRVGGDGGGERVPRIRGFND